MSATKVIYAKSVCDIDFTELKKQGIDCVLFDIESTLTPWGSDQVSSRIQKCVTAKAPLKRGIVTNLNKRDADRAQRVADVIKAQSYQYPRHWQDRKPSGDMLRACMEELGASAENTVMVGDKLYDILAAKNAGVSQAIWVDKLPGADHWFDRWIYRRVDPILKKLVR